LATVNCWVKVALGGMGRGGEPPPPDGEVGRGRSGVGVRVGGTGVAVAELVGVGEGWVSVGVGVGTVGVAEGAMTGDGTSVGTSGVGVAGTEVGVLVWANGVGDGLDEASTRWRGVETTGVSGWRGTSARAQARMAPARLMTARSRRRAAGVSMQGVFFVSARAMRLNGN
jgi:hypothetical protein